MTHGDINCEISTLAGRGELKRKRIATSNKIIHAMAQSIIDARDTIKRLNAL